MSGHPYASQPYYHLVNPHLQSDNQQHFPGAGGYYPNAHTNASSPLGHSSQPPHSTSVNSASRYIGQPQEGYPIHQPRQGAYDQATGILSTRGGYSQGQGQVQGQGQAGYQGGVGTVYYATGSVASGQGQTHGQYTGSSASPYPYVQAQGYTYPVGTPQQPQHLSPSPSIAASAHVQSPYTSLGQTLSPDPAYQYQQQAYHQPSQGQYHQLQQGQYQQQQQQPAQTGPTSIDPSFFRSASPLPYLARPPNPSAAFPGASPVVAFHPSGVPLDGAGSASPSKVPKIKLRLNPAPNGTLDGNTGSSSHISMPPRSQPSRGGSTASHVEHELRVRPSRQAASVAITQARAQLEDDSEGEYEDEVPAGRSTRKAGAGGGSRRTSGAHQFSPSDVKSEIYPAEDTTSRRPTRDRKAPQRFGGEDEFEDRLMETSPIAPSPKIRLTANKGRKGRKIVDPDDEDEYFDGVEASQDPEVGVEGQGGGFEDAEGEEEETPVKLRRAFPPRQLGGADAGASTDRRLSASHQTTHPTRNGRPVRNSRSRNHYGNESDQHSFQPDNSDDGSGSEETESDDVLGQSIRGTSEELATSDDDAGSYGRPRSKRRPRKKASAARRNTNARNSTSAGTRRSARIKVAGSDEDDDEEYGGGRGGGKGGGRRNLRERKSQVNYALPPVDISMELAQQEVLGAANARVNGRGSFSAGAGVGVGGVAGALGGLGARGKSTGARARSLVAGARFGGGGGFAGLGGLGGRGVRAMGEDTSDSDLDILSGPKTGGTANTSNAGGMGMAGAGGAAPAGGAGKIGAPTDVANFGRVNPKSSMADADPLGVDMNVTFDNVGGLDDHINQLKEMVALPLLYPEVFQQFGITPPRGVLFHGPPGTGKTLLARALAASCSTGNTKIAFFMRKGADVLSKWVGEAERQLRMLFEEARAAQPSIIFFDEIDGLAPVRSSKQDQIHASLVSTLLALMDGMDGRGQVIVIGATNRPDSVDPALRRPGRFDREFYFPLPNKEARKKIIRINTRKWTPPLDDGMVERLAGLTKGYGGADMRALCTEAALNAIQRRYPQIYESTDRYELDTTSIEVKAKDFMMSIKKIVPSSARSTSSTAIPLPPHLVPLLSTPLKRIKAKVDDVLPRHKHKTALEEAMFEDDEAELNEEGAVLVQSLDKMRTYRPRLLISGPAGMGQAYLGPAILHHLEGFHVQNLDLGTPEAALVQLFVEAKRHQPSIIYVPNLSAWSATLSDSARATFKSLLDGIQPSEPVLLLGVVEEEEVSAEVRSWFGWGGEGDIELAPPSESERSEYFLPLLTHLQTPPTSWPDALPRRPRVLEKLPLAAPLPERQRSQAEIEAEHERDKSAMNMMVLSFTGLLSDWAKRYKRLVLQLKEDVFALHQVLVEQSLHAQPADATLTEVTEVDASMVNGEGSEIPSISLQPPTQQVAEGEPEQMLLDDTYGAVPAVDSSSFDAPPPAPPTVAEQAAPAPIPGPDWTPYDLDLDKMQLKLIKFKYHRPRDFLDDVDRIAANAEHLGDLDKLNKVAEMTAHAYLHVSEFEPKWMPEFDAFAERMRRKKEERRAQKVKEKEEKEKEAVVNGNINGEVREQGQKRPREGEDVDMDGEREGKRARSAEPSQTDPTTIPSTDGTTATASDSLAATVPPPLTSTAVTIPTDTAAMPTTPPAPVYPPFIIPVEPLAELTQSLRVDTASFSIEQLEQLRAAVFDRIWRKRALWDRTEVLEELQQTLASFVRNVKRVQGVKMGVV